MSFLSRTDFEKYSNLVKFFNCYVYSCRIKISVHLLLNYGTCFSYDLFESERNIIAFCEMNDIYDKYDGSS